MKLKSLILVVSLLGAGLVLQPSRANAPQYPMYIPQLWIIQENTLSSIASPIYVRPLIYKTLLSCIEFKESSGNDYAVGKAGEKGCLQYMSATFKHYCIDKFNVANNMEDIWNCEIQKQCADQMIEYNWNLIHQWTTAHLCY